VSSEGAAAASAAARRRGAASRKATLQARAPDEDSHRRPRANIQKPAHYEASARDAPAHSTYQQRAEDSDFSESKFPSLERLDRLLQRRALIGVLGCRQ
jgi:hypothetical protein